MKLLSPKLFTLAILLAAALVLASADAVSDNEMQKHEATESRDVVEEKLRVQSLKNSSMAERSGGALNEHAVDNPEEIASMVDE
ncbi:hypothetical protein glysoja_038068 [Glycine soja]|nr:hypothetical protein glysoja_038068 [Glycine soja]